MRRRVSIWTGILCALIFIFGNLLYTDKIYYLIHPRMMKFVFAGMMILILLLVSDLLKQKSPKELSKLNSRSVMMFFLPVILGGVFLTTSPIKGLAYNKEIKEHSHVHGELHEEHESEDDEDAFIHIYKEIQHKVFSRNEIIKVEGVMVQRGYESFICKVLMSCCAADSQIIGIRVEGDTQGIKEEPCSITGALKYVNGEPVLDIIEIKKIEDIKKIYIYR